MLKKYFVFVICLLIPYCAFAQISIGIRGPLAFNSRAFVDTGNSYESLGGLGTNIGGIFKYGFTERFAFQTEINYHNARLGYYSIDGSFQHGDEPIVSHHDGASFRFDFIEIPLLIQVAGKTSFRGFAETGVSLKYLLAANHHVNNYINDLHNEYSYDARKYFNPIMLTGNIGGGVMLDLWNLTFSAGIRIGYDIIPIGKNIVDEASINWSFNNMRLAHFSVLIGVIYNFN
jgi:hypothetical protein